MKNGKYDLFYKHKGHNSYHKLRQNKDIFEFEIDGENIHLLNKDNEFGQRRIRTESIETLLSYTPESIRRRYVYDSIVLCVDCSGYEDKGYRNLTRDRLYQVVLCDIVNGYYPHTTVKISDSSIILIRAKEERELMDKLTKSMGDIDNTFKELETKLQEDINAKQKS